MHQRFAEAPKVDANQRRPSNHRDQRAEGAQLYLRRGAGGRCITHSYDRISSGQEHEQVQVVQQHFERQRGGGKKPASVVRFEVLQFQGCTGKSAVHPAKSNYL